MIVIQWFFSYFLVAMIAFFFKRKEPNVRIRTLYIHLFIGVSVILLTIAGARIEWNASAYALGIVAISFVLATLLLGRLGFAYGLSSCLQEWCLLLSATYLGAATGFLVAAIATSIPYTIAHRTEGKEWLWKPLILFAWSLASICLYLISKQPLYNVALHILLGAALIRSGLLYRYA